MCIVWLLLPPVSLCCHARGWPVLTVASQSQFLEPVSPLVKSTGLEGTDELCATWFSYSRPVPAS